MTMKLKQLPRSKAKTAWGLWRDVRKAVLQDYRRVDMLVTTEQVSPEAKNKPPCGVVGCLVGWGTILAGKPWDRGGLFTQMENLLGDEIIYHMPIRDPKNHGAVKGEMFYLFNSGFGDACGRTRPGTRAHMRAVVARLDRWMKLNEKALKARKIRLRDSSCLSLT